MTVPQADIDGCAHAHEQLTVLVAGSSDADMRRASNLPEWTVGHVLTHLARNAEAMCRRIDGAARGKAVEQYVGGAVGRAAAIEAGAGRGADDIVTDLKLWADQLDEAFRSVADDVWDRMVSTMSGGEHPVSMLPFRRWREVEIHMVDLGLGITADDWSQSLVDRALPQLVAGLTDRADERVLMAWLLGRGPAPDVGPWG